MHRLLSYISFLGFIGTSAFHFFALRRRWPRLNSHRSAAADSGAIPVGVLLSVYLHRFELLARASTGELFATKTRYVFCMCLLTKLCSG